MQKLEISKMITLSTIHITSKLSEKIMDLDIMGLVIYEKSDYGWFIFCDWHELDLRSVPRDLRAILKFAKNHDCDWVCLDGDGMEVECLKKYKR